LFVAAKPSSPIPLENRSRSAIALGIMALAILLAFSRAAWGGLANHLGLHAGG